MSKLFPNATDYLTITKRMSSKIVASIEQEIGIPLDESEKSEFNFYELRTLNNNQAVTVGTAMALAGKGEYGAIEVVIGVDLGGKVSAVEIQRSREKASRTLRGDAFLGQFIGKSAESALSFGVDLKSVDDATKGAEAIRLAIKKMLIFQKVMSNAPIIEETILKNIGERP